MPERSEAHPSLIPTLTIQLQDQSNTSPVRDSAAGQLVDIAQNHPDYRHQCIAIITATLERYQRNPIELNTLLIKHLITLKGAESAQMVEQVMRAGEYDRGIGDWRQISQQLGVASKPKPPTQSAPPANKPAPTPQPDISPNPALAAATISSAPRLSPKQKDKLRAQRKQERKAKKQNRRR